MKILFFSAYPGFSGSHCMAMQIAMACRDAGHEVVAAAPDENMEFLERAAAKGIPAAAIPAPVDLLEFGKAPLKRNLISRAALVLTKLLPYNFRVRRFLRSENIDVVYAAQERAVVQAGLAARLAGIPLLWHVQSGLSAGSKPVHRWCERFSSRLVCVSTAVADNVSETLGLKAGDRLRVIHNGIPDIASPPPETGPPGNGSPLRVLFAGSVVPEKGPHHLVRALAEIASAGRNGIHARIAGPPRNEPYLQFLESLVREHGLENQVEFLGFSDDIPRLIMESDIVVCPSVERERLESKFGDWEVNWKEGFCLVALEAMRAAVPVIASDSYGLREVVADGESGIRIPAGDGSALANALLDLQGDNARRRRLGAGGRRRYIEFFSVERMTDRFLDEFDSIRPR